MSVEEKTAIVQREEQNVLLRSLLGATRHIGLAILTVVIAGIAVLISDHYKLARLIEIHNSLISISENNQKEIIRLSRLSPSLENRWTWPMHREWSDKLKDNNPNLVVPPAREIHESGLFELKSNIGP